MAARVLSRERTYRYRTVGSDERAARFTTCLDRCRTGGFTVRTGTDRPQDLLRYGALRRKALIGAVAIPLTLGLLVPPSASAVDYVNTKKIRKAVTVNGILEHERVLQRIANENGGTRASGTPGYDASAKYVAAS